MLEEQVTEDVKPVVEYDLEDEEAGDEEFQEPQMSDQEAFVRAALSGDAVSAQDVANNLIANRVDAKIEDMRANAAAKLIQPDNTPDDEQED